MQQQAIAAVVVVRQAPAEVIIFSASGPSEEPTFIESPLNEGRC